MELNLFIAELESSLIRRGISPDVAGRHVHTLRRTFTQDDLNEIARIQSSDEIEDIAENIAHILTKNKIKARPVGEAELPRPQPQPPAAPQRWQEDYSTRPGRQMAQRRVEPAHDYRNDEVDDFFEEFDGKDKTTKGFYTFWLIFIFTLPLTAALAVAFFAVFIGLFVVLSAMIVALIAALVGVVAVGAGVSLVGIIFGITQLFTFMAAGLYEIGLGVMIIGIVMFVGILLYNLAIRFLPWIIRLVARLLRFTCGKIRDLFYYLRRECYQL